MKREKKKESQTKYQAGDIFVVYSGTFSVRIINQVQQFWDINKKTKYNYTDVIIYTDGTIIKTLRTIQNKNIHKYGDHLFLVGRPNGMTEKIRAGITPYKNTSAKAILGGGFLFIFFCQRQSIYQPVISRFAWSLLQSFSMRLDIFRHKKTSPRMLLQIG